MEDSKEALQKPRERVKAFGTDVVPDVIPIRKGVSGAPSTNAFPGAGEDTPRRSEIVFFKSWLQPGSSTAHCRSPATPTA